MRWSRLWLLLVVFLGAIALTPPRTPSPPIGWEERVTPGYDPSVESVVVRMGYADWGSDERMKAAWAKWDEGAVDVLLKLYDDKAWMELRQRVLQLLSLSPHERAVRWLDDTFKTLATKSDLTEEERQTLGYLLYSPQKPDAEATRQRVELCLREGNQYCRSWAVGQLINQRTEESLTRVTEIAESLPEQERQGWLKGVDEARGYIRAQEPMEPIGAKGEGK